MIGELCKRLGIGQTTYYRYEGVLYQAPKRKGKIRVFSEEDFERIHGALIRVPRLKIRSLSKELLIGSFSKMNIEKKGVQ